jgi:hypothetical protein
MEFAQLYSIRKLAHILLCGVNPIWDGGKEVLVRGDSDVFGRQTLNGQMS